MRREPSASQLTASSIRRAMETLASRSDLPQPARRRGIAALAKALERLPTYYSKNAAAPIETHKEMGKKGSAAAKEG